MTDTHVFFTELCAGSESIGPLKARATSINESLGDMGYKTWFNVGKRSILKCPSAIENTKVVLVFVTKSYMNSCDMNGYCAKEFKYAFEKNDGSYMIPIILEHRMLDSSKWSGPLGMGLSEATAVPMTFDHDSDHFQSSIQELKQEIDNQLAKLNVPIPAPSRSPAAAISSLIGANIVGNENRVQINIGTLNYGQTQPAHPPQPVKTLGESSTTSGPVHQQPVQATQSTGAVVPRTTRPAPPPPSTRLAALTLSPFRHAAAPSPAARDFSHLFHDRIQFLMLPKEQRVPAVLASPDVSSVFMLLEGIVRAECVRYVGKQQVTAMLQLKQARGWSRVPAGFLDSMFWFSAGYPAVGKLVKECRDLVSEGDCIRVKGTPVTNLLDLVCKEQVYVFKHPGIVTCDNTSQCGFLVKITPLTRGDPASFKIQLVTDPALYHGAGVHYHDTISVDKMHLVVEWYEESDKKWGNMCVSWWGRPEYNEDGDVWWRGWRCSASRKARLVVYYNTTS